jgi:hypothetical protein
VEFPASIKKKLLSNWSLLIIVADGDNPVRSRLHQTPPKLAEYSVDRRARIRVYSLTVPKDPRVAVIATAATNVPVLFPDADLQRIKTENIDSSLCS